MAVSFLPVFYSHLALNDVPALFALMVSVYGSAGVLVRGRLRDYLIAGGGPRACRGDQVHGRDRRAAAAGRGRRRPRALAVAPAPALGSLAAAGVAGAGRLRGREPARAAVVLRVLGGRQEAGERRGRSRQAGPRLRLGRRVLPVGPDLGSRLGAGARAALGAGLAVAPRLAAGAVPRPVAGPVPRSTWDCRTVTSGAGSCPRFRRSSCSRRSRRCGSPTWCACRARVRALVLALPRSCWSARASSTAFISIACFRATTPATWRARGWSRNVPAGLEDRRRADRAEAWTTDVGRAPPTRELGLTPSGAAGASSSSRRTTLDEQGQKAARQRRADDRDRGLRAHHAAGADRRLCARRLLLGRDRLDAVRPRLRGARQGPERDSLLPGRSRATASSFTGSTHTSPGEGPVEVQLRLELRLLPDGV